MAVRRWISGAAVAGLVVSAWGVVAPGGAVAGEGNGASEQVVLSMNPGMTTQQLDQEITRLSGSTGLTRAEVLRRLAEEAGSGQLDEPGPARRSSGSSGSSGGSGKAPLPGARRAGDVFVHSSKTAGYDHGHAGIYTKNRIVAEAPGSGSKSRRINVRQKTVPSGKTYLYRVGRSAKRRSAAITQVKKYYLSKPYDFNFLRNRSNGSGKLNCSELVWRAYRWSTYKRIDVDGNKGWGVYPRDIKSSGWTHRYKKVT